MCFSPEVDVVAASAITVFAVDALKHNKNLRSLPIALVPAIFAIHTFSDALVWWSERGQISNSIGSIAAWIYLFIAFVLLPIFVPIATNLIEPKGWRKNLIGLIAFGGLLAGVDNAISILQGNTTVVACNYYVDYHVGGTTALAGIFYVVATVGAIALSGQRHLKSWGFINAVVVLVLAIWANHKLPSLWCFWAAITSVFVSWFIRHIGRENNHGQPWPWQRSEKINVEVV